MLLHLWPLLHLWTNVITLVTFITFVTSYYICTFNICSHHALLYLEETDQQVLMEVVYFKLLGMIWSLLIEIILIQIVK